MVPNDLLQTFDTVTAVIVREWVMERWWAVSEGVRNFIGCPYKWRRALRG